MNTRLILLGMALLTLLLAPFSAGARGDREQRGESRIIVRSDDGSFMLDEADLEGLLQSLEGLGPEIEEAVQEALEGLDGLDFDFDFDIDGRHGFVVGDWDDRDWEQWSEDFSERMSEMAERLSERSEQRNWRVRSFRSDERDELQDQIRELKREIRRLTSELDDLRGEGEG